MPIDKKDIAFVINPKSGSSNHKGIVSMIQKGMDNALYSCHVLETEYAGHAVSLAARCASEGMFAVVAIGGDGTVNEVARSLTHTDTALGIIPCGSGNGLARHLQIPTTIKKAIDIINKGNVETIDYGKINNQNFFCTCGVGFDAFVSLKFAESNKRGPLTYLEKTLIEGLNYKPETYDITIDGNTEHYKAFLVACGNASQYGNNAYITPRANLKDGMLDVTILTPFTLLDVPEIALQLFTKTIDQNTNIKTRQCKEVHIHRESPGVVHFDGDPTIMGEDIEVRIIPNGLKVITPNADSLNPYMLTKTREVFSDIETLTDKAFGELAQKNKEIIKKSRKQLKRLTKD